MNSLVQKFASWFNLFLVYALLYPMIAPLSMASAASVEVGFTSLEPQPSLPAPGFSPSPTARVATDSLPTESSSVSKQEQNLLPALQTPTYAWPQYLYNAAHTGYNSLETTLKPPLTLSWSFEPTVSGDYFPVHTPVVAGNNVFTAIGHNNDTTTIYALDVDSGAVVWQTTLSGILYTSSMVADNGILYVTASETFYALSITGGNLLWQRSFPAFLEPPVVDGNTIYLIAARWISPYVQFQEVYALDKQAGDSLWSYRPSNPAGDSGAPIIINNALVFDNGRGLISLDKTTGQLLWSRSTNSDTWYWDVSGYPAANLVYQWSGILEAIDANTGQVVWSYSHFTGYTQTTPIVVDGTVYQVNLWESDDKAYLYSFDAVTGALRNKVEIFLISGDYVFMTAANGILYITTDQYYYPLVRAIDLATGETVWESAEVNASVSPIVIANDKIFVDSYDQGLFVYGGSLVNVDLLAPDGNPVTQLITNTNGWPTPNPLTATVTLRCPAGGADCVEPFNLTIDSNDNARFYLYATDWDSEGIDVDCQEIYGGANPNSHKSYLADCIRAGTSSSLTLFAGETKTMYWNIWIQPSVTATLRLTATWGANTDNYTVQVPQAQIHPLVIIPGYIGTWPPEHGGDLDPLQKTYDNLVEALQRIGYELGDAGSGATLIPFGWDWRAPFGDTGKVLLEADVDSIRDIANRTKSYVDYEQVDIIAHSAGGLVARAFIEDSTANNQDKVNLLITLGTPHRGVPAAYRGGRGGQYDAIFPGNPQTATGVTAGLIACNEGFLAGSSALSLGRAEKIVLDEEELYEFVKNNIPSTEDLLPTRDVTPTYIVDMTNPSVSYPYGNPAGTPPDNPFLEDMRTSGGDYDVSKLLVPDIISIFSPNFLPDLAEGTYEVDAPPYGQGDNVIWGHGKVISITQVPGDGLIPAYSANLTQLSALSGAPNITIFNADSVHHMSLPADSVMVRRLISYVTGIDVINNATLWTRAVPQPLVLTIAGKTIPIEAIYEIVTCSPVRTLVTDPLGRRAGLDPDTGAIINEIPGAIVTKDGDDPHLIMVPRIQGQYQIKAMGIDNGDYTLGAFDIFSGTIQITGRIFTGTTTVGQSLQVSFDSSVFQEENGQVVMEAEHFNWQIGEVNRAWITQTMQAGYVGSGYLSALPDVDRIYTKAITTTSPQLEYTINFTTTGTYYVWVRGYAPNGAGDSVYVSLDDQSPVILTALPPRQWAWANITGQGQRLTVEVTEPGEHTLFLWQREDGLKIDRFVLTVDDNYNPQGNGPNESPRIGVD